MENISKPLFICYIEKEILDFQNVNFIIKSFKQILPNYDVLVLSTNEKTHCQVFFPTNETKEESFEVHKKIAQLATSRNIRVIL